MNCRFFFLFMFLFSSSLFGAEESSLLGNIIKKVDKAKSMEHIEISPKVNILVESITIFPRKHKAKKGDVVTFSYDIKNSKDDVNFVTWSGVTGRKYQKKFIINTSNLTEGKRYIISAQLNKVIKAKAILYIEKAPQLPITVSIYPKNKSVKKGEKVTFTAKASNVGAEIYSIKWRGPSGTQSGNRYIVNTNNLKAGNHTLTAQVGKSKLARATLTVEALPVIQYQAYISADKKNILEGSKVVFRGSVSPSLSQVKYQFFYGDGSSDTSTNTQSSHSYSKVGIYKAYVKATHNKVNSSLGERIGGNSSNPIIKRSTIVTIHVKAKPKPPLPINYKLFMKASPLSIREGEKVNFSFFIQPKNKKIQYKFDFGNGQKTKWSTKSSYSTHYTKKGIYYPSVHARVGQDYLKKQGVKVRVKAKKVVAPSIPEPPIEPKSIDYKLSFISSETSIMEGDSIDFSILLTPQTNEAQYQFNFGNEEKSEWSSLNSHSKHYAKAGNYTVSVKLRIAGKFIEKKTIAIKVEEQIKVEPDKEPNEDFTFTFPGGSVSLNIEELSILGIGLLAIVILLKNVFSVLREIFEKPKVDKPKPVKVFNKFKLQAINQDDIVHKVEMEPMNQSFEVRFIPIEDNGEHTIEEEERK